jgi:ABC-type Fe3+/spermidine/putrescine transport system ATPase subunit
VTGIRLDRVTKIYPRQQTAAVDALSLAIDTQHLLALLGPSGSGKSSILKVIAGIEQPDGGDICFDGVSILAVPAYRRNAVLMFQKAYLFPFLSVADNIAFGLRARGAQRATIAAEVARMLDLVELPGVERKQPAQLSGGEQQRVALARALVLRPRVLLLDEPFSSLDPTVRQTLQTAVRRIQRELGITSVLVTHDRVEALAMADRIALLERGRLVASDHPDRLYQRPPNVGAARQMGIQAFLRGELIGTTLHSQFGPLALAPDALSLDRSDAALIYAIRPEHLRLLAEPAPNALAARIVERSFRGEFVDYQLTVAAEQLHVRAVQPLDALGEEVYLQFPPEHIFALQDDMHRTEAGP